MMPTKYLYVLLLIICARDLSANVCYDCDGMTFNYTITIDNLPSPSDHNCSIVTADHICSVRISWFSNGESEVHFVADPDLPSDTVLARTLRRVTMWSGEYVTSKYIAYNCKASNTTPCNNADNLKRVISAAALPTDEQIEKFDKLIVPTTHFEGHLCLQFSNRSICANTILNSCQQCVGIMEYSEEFRACSMCPSGKAVTNFVDSFTTFFLGNRTQSDLITLACRKYGACNSLENMEQIKNTLMTNFDYEKFSSPSTTSTTAPITSSVSILFSAISIQRSAVYLSFVLLIMKFFLHS